MNDLRYSVRALRRDLRLTTFALLTVALGIGATVTVFSVIDALLLRPLPLREAERLMWIANGDAYDLSMRTAQVQYVWALERDGRSLVDVAGYSEFYGVGDHTLTSGAGEPERLTGVEVTRGFFPLLGVSPIVGRQFTADEAVDDGPRVVLLSHRLWARRFASDRGIVGRAIVLDGAPATVVGVLPSTFDFGTIFAPGRQVDYYRPFPLTDRRNNQGNTLALVGRMRAGATVADVQREATVIAERARRDGETRRRTNEFHPIVRGLRDHVSGAFRPALLVLAGGVALVMLMVCANLSNLLLTRAAAREREVAVRIALGAGRARLLRQLLTESLVLAGGGAALGLGLASGGTLALSRTQSVRLPLLDQVHVDWIALAFTVGAAVVTGLVFGLTPALRVSALRVDESLRDAARGSTGGRHEWTRAAIVVAELALTCTLLVGAGLLTRSFVRVLDQDLGFRPERAVALRIDPSRRFASAGARAAYFDEALRRVRETPGVQAAGLTDVLPMGFNRIWNVATERPAAPDRQFPAFVRVVSDAYLRAMGVRLRAGRDFLPTDDSASAPVAIVNAALARKLWPGQDPLGRTLLGFGEAPARVVGVVEGLRYQSVEEEAGSDLYFPMRQMPDYSAVYVVARGARPAAELVAAVRAALRPTDPTLALTEVRTLQDIVDASVSPRRLIVTLLAGFAAFALVLASLGTYAVISYGVAQRRREIGIRMALGATPARVRSTVLSRTLRLTAAGLATGLLASWALGRLLGGLLYGVGAGDPLTFAGTLAVLALVAAAAGWLPARRAARQNPANVLRAP
ncbi:permease (plasmid) [Gemmatirosa kalamazoonensis]|uniref:Permease n=1 Tax=Gemmatirosa kalamazoonensis TaxID=861299 RepID=W0RSU9_9BACT|nr:ABC transporter permease [Gemmatirosa kalamazoonensis]AHG93390.1 permease [Gemmatirosa kalamazoonensis]